jgi:hypothetical protein
MDYRSISKESLKTAIVVGTLLILLNRYEEIWSRSFSEKDLAKWSLNYLMPFCVSFYSRYMALKREIQRKSY